MLGWSGRVSPDAGWLAIGSLTANKRTEIVVQLSRNKRKHYRASTIATCTARAMFEATVCESRGDSAPSRITRELAPAHFILVLFEAKTSDVRCGEMYGSILS